MVDVRNRRVFDPVKVTYGEIEIVVSEGRL